MASAVLAVAVTVVVLPIVLETIVTVGPPPGPAPLVSRTGVRQGDPCRPMFFALALQPILEAVRDAHPDVAVVAYADDVFPLGAPTALPVAYRAFPARAKAIGLHARPAQCTVYSPASDVSPVATQLGVTHAPDGLVAAGTPVGTDPFIRAHVLNVARYACAQVRRLSFTPRSFGEDSEP